MTAQITAIFVLGILAANLIWLIPERRAFDAMVLMTAAVIGWQSPETLAWLFSATVLTWAALKWSDRRAAHNLAASVIAVLLLGGFVAAQFTSGLLWIGASYFTLRLLHVIGDWWTRSLSPPPFMELLRYQFFLPVMVVGPIHRYQTFSRQVARRRWDPQSYWIGLERCLLGFFMAHVLGSYAMGSVETRVEAMVGNPGRFDTVWILSALEWAKLYFVFAGLCEIALGASRIAGLQLEENFNRPWRATSLLDFWNRWHMSLTNWSRDYAYRPVMAISRSPILGVIAAMLVIGLWHAISPYYLLWAIWQASGILLSRWLGSRLPALHLPSWIKLPLVAVGILGWLSLARPFITIVLGVDYDANASHP